MALDMGNRDHLIAVEAAWDETQRRKTGCLKRNGTLNYIVFNSSLKPQKNLSFIGYD